MIMALAKVVYMFGPSQKSICSIIVLGRCKMTSESVFSLYPKDLVPRSSKVPQIITKPPSLKEVCVLVMFFVFLPSRENSVAALNWLGQSQLELLRLDWNEKTHFCRVCLCMAVIHSFVFYYLTHFEYTYYFSVSSVYLIPLGKIHPGLCFLRRKLMWRWLSLFKSLQSLTRIK